MSAYTAGPSGSGDTHTPKMISGGSGKKAPAKKAAKAAKATKAAKKAMPPKKMPPMKGMM